MQWFQYKPGLVGEAERVTHCAASSTRDERLRSMCQREFAPTQVEEVAEPGTTPHDGQSWSGAPCVPCLMLVMAATDATKEVGNNSEHDAPDDADDLLPTVVPAPSSPASGSTETETTANEARRLRQTKAALAVSLRKTQWLLDDAAHQIPGDCFDHTQAAELAETLEELAALVRKSIGGPVVATEVEQ